jgi:hypothetical protein
MRVAQPEGKRGSLKWIQRAVNANPSVLNNPILARIGATRIEWLSPLTSDNYAEYRDRQFLDRLELSHLHQKLRDFWPARGPQWDALGRSDADDVLLIEAKAHIDELCSPSSASTGESRARIEAALARTAGVLGAAPRAPWIDVFYQLANRIAHLHFLRANGVKAWLVLVNFVGDSEMDGAPGSAAAWEAAYRVVHHVMGLGARHALARQIVHVYPGVAELS